MTAWRRFANAIAVAGLAGCAATVAPTSPPPQASHGPSASLSDVVPAPETGPWVRIAIDDPSQSLQLSAASIVGSGFVVVGASGGAGEVPRAFSTVDGATWTEETISGRFSAPTRLLPWGDRLVGIGSGETSLCAHPYAMSTWVRSADAIWAEAPFDKVFCDNGGDIVVLDGRLWLAGSVRDLPQLMTSDDGLHWTSHAGELHGRFPWAAAVDDSGLWVFARDDGGRTTALHRRDGTTFDEIPLAAPGGQAIDVIAATTIRGEVNVLVAAGDAIGWLRPDQAGGWIQTRVGGMPPQALGRLAPFGPGVLFIGQDHDGHSVALTSADGVTWSPIPLPAELTGEFAVRDIVVGNGRAVLVAQILAPDGSGLVGALWTAPAGVAAP